MRFLLSFLAVVVLIAAAPALAADSVIAVQPDPAKVETTDPITDGRIALATKIHEKVNVREKLFKAMEVVTQFMTPSEKADFWSKMNTAITEEQINKISIDAMADTYTEDELRAMLTFYSSPAGQTAEAKRTDYEKKVTPEFTKLIDKAVVNSGVFAKPQINNLNQNLLQR